MVMVVSLTQSRSLSLLLLNTARIAAEVDNFSVLVGLGVAGGDESVVVAFEGCIEGSIEEDVGGVVIVFLVVVVVAVTTIVGVVVADTMLP